MQKDQGSKRFADLVPVSVEDLKRSLEALKERIELTRD
jgi:hypothetical protein